MAVVVSTPVSSCCTIVSLPLPVLRKVNEAVFQPGEFAMTENRGDGEKRPS